MTRESDPSIGHASSMSRRDARRLLVGDVDDDDVGELLVGDRARDRRADGAGAADDCDFSIHEAPMCSAELSYMFPMIGVGELPTSSARSRPSICRARS